MFKLDQTGRFEAMTQRCLPCCKMDMDVDGEEESREEKRETGRGRGVVVPEVDGQLSLPERP